MVPEVPPLFLGYQLGSVTIPGRKHFKDQTTSCISSLVSCWSDNAVLQLLDMLCYCFWRGSSDGGPKQAYPSCRSHTYYPILPACFVFYLASYLARLILLCGWLHIIIALYQLTSSKWSTPSKFQQLFYRTARWLHLDGVFL